MRSDRTLRYWYKKINKKFFDGCCPDDVLIRWANDKDMEGPRKCEEMYLGWATRADDGHHKYEIVLNRDLHKKGFWGYRISTLVHEMVHLATDLKDSHGPAFEQWRLYISDRGIFRKHAIRRGITLF